MYKYDNNKYGPYLRSGAFSSISSKVSSEDLWDISLRLYQQNNQTISTSLYFMHIIILS